MATLASGPRPKFFGDVLEDDHVGAFGGGRRIIGVFGRTWLEGFSGAGVGWLARQIWRRRSWHSSVRPIGEEPVRHPAARVGSHRYGPMSTMTMMTAKMEAGFGCGGPKPQ